MFGKTNTTVLNLQIHHIIRLVISATLRQLEIFNAVVDSGQITKASKQLFITQSAVRLALNEMENQLGGPLFDRSGRSLGLNDRGRFFFRSVVKLWIN